MSGIMARKIGMTRIFEENGEVVPVTVLEAQPNPVTQVKTVKTDGYEALQIGYRTQKKQRLNKPTLGHLEKSGAPPVSRFCEVPVPKKGASAGEFLDVSMFNPGEKVDVTGLSKGKGFQGVVKRHGFSCGDSTHGSKSQRVPGSIGQCATPARVWKNKKMPGRDGGKKVTVRNLEVVQVDSEKNLLVLKGAVPGSKNGYILIRKQKSGGEK